MRKSYGSMLILLLTVVGCSSGEENPPAPVTPPTKHIPISLSCGIGSRATDSGFESNDCIGLYVVNRNGETPGTLQLTGNHVDNMRFTYNGNWISETDIFWKDETTAADFYTYYPFGKLTTLAAHPFAVNENQSTVVGYKASDFLWGKTANVAPTEKAVSITVKHLFCCAVVTIMAGNGFTEESLNAANIKVKMNQLKTKATINLANGTVTAVENPHDITLLAESKTSYKALIVPQTVAVGNLITITIEGRDYQLEKEFTFVGGKQHTFPITVSKTSNGVNVDIGAWEDDDMDNGGTAE